MARGPLVGFRQTLLGLQFDGNDIVAATFLLESGYSLAMIILSVFVPLVLAIAFFYWPPIQSTIFFSDSGYRLKYSDFEQLIHWSDISGGKLFTDGLLIYHASQEPRWIPFESLLDPLGRDRLINLFRLNSSVDQALLSIES